MIKAYVFDLDGVIYRGWELQETAKETLAELERRGAAIFAYTNNAMRTRRSYVDKLNKLGITQFHVDRVMTSAYATALYLKEKGAVGKSVYMIAGDGLYEELTAVGMKVYRGTEGEEVPVDYVIVGADKDFNYGKLARAQHGILGGAEFIATNTDPTYPLENGTLNPGGGSLVAAVKTASGTEPYVIGKPYTYAFEKILSIAGAAPDEAMMVGDRLDTDIAVANRAGAYSGLVLTGVTTLEEAEKATGELVPTKILRRLSDLLD